MEVKLGLADFTYFMSRRAGVMSDSGLLHKAAEWGLQCVQIGLGKPGDTERREALRREAEELSLELLGAGGGRPSVEGFEREIESAAELGMTVCRHASGPFRLRQEPVPPADYVESLRTVAGQAEDANVTIAIENHQDYTAEELAGIVRALDSSHVGVCLDTGNSIALLEDPIETAKTLAPFTRMVHLKEYFVLPAEHGVDLVGTPIGTGVVDNETIMDVLREAAPADVLCVTIENPLERCAVPILSAEFVEEFAARPIGDLAAVLSLVAKSREIHPDPVELPQEGDATDEEIAAAEEACNRQAVEYCRERLGL
jgi:sugar phosphate isomerase/epimerase